MHNIPTILILILFITIFCFLPALGAILIVFTFIYTELKPNIKPTKSSNHTIIESPQELLFSFRENKRAYLKDPKWQYKRYLVFERDNFTCRSCGISNTELHVHHLRDYNRLGHESTSSLVTLCSPCHQYQHDQLGYPQTYDDYMNWNVNLIKKDPNENNTIRPRYS